MSFARLSDFVGAGISHKGSQSADRMQLGRVEPKIDSWDRFSQWVIRHSLRFGMFFYHLLVLVLTGLGRQKQPHSADGYRILLTGSFYADNWVRAHLGPLAAAQQCARVCLVTTWPVPPIDKVDVIHPPRWLSCVIDPVSARLLTFLWVGLRTRPHIVGGFHLLFNGLLSVVLARLIGARTLYFCVGGPEEFLSGGIMSENRFFGKLRSPDSLLEQRLLRAIGYFDWIITMGSRAERFFTASGVGRRCEVIAGGINGTIFSPNNSLPTTDLIIVARLVPVKRLDVFLHALKEVSKAVPEVTATIVGDGELRATLQQIAYDYGVSQRVHFVGHQQDVITWLKSARVFVLTSDSEGLALSLMEAMMCGLPAVVSRVGDLTDLVEDSINGYVVERDTPQQFAARIIELLNDEKKLHAFSVAARNAALRYETQATTHRWEQVLA